MAEQKRPWGWPIALVLSAVGIALFWITWFASGDYATEGNECYRMFENTFPLPDAIMALLMLALARQVWLGNSGLWQLAAGINGMVLCLGNLDTLYHLQHGTFEALPEMDAVLALLISIYCYGMTLALALRFARGLGKTTPNIAARVVAGCMALYALAVCGYWAAVGIPRDVAALACFEQFTAAFWLADFATVVTAIAAAYGLWTGWRWGAYAAYATLGGLFFATLNFTALTALYPEALGDQRAGAAILCVVCLAVVAALTVGVRRGVGQIHA